jgi:signal transduction histidine kinase
MDVVGFATDVSVRKRLEERVLKAERLAAIGETAAMVGHDLRNPLQGMAGASYVLKQQLGSNPSEKAREMLELIEDELDYSDKIVTDLLDFSGEITLSLTQTTPRQITNDALQLVKIPKNVTVENQTEAEPIMRVDAGKVQRLFVNVVGNAIDAMPGGGKLTIRSKKSNNAVQITFADTGTGMPKKVMENLWKPLQTTKAKGIGLGLAICKRIVEAHGGSISVESSGGKGTTFTIALPTNPKVGGGD